MLSEPTRARLRAPLLRLQITAAALLSLVAIIAMWTSVHHVSPGAQRPLHAAVPAGGAHGTTQPTSGWGRVTPVHHHM